jgi:signal transduction histidine kinase
MPIERDGETVAALVYDASLDDDPELVEAVSAAAAIDNEQLHTESPERLEELKAPRERIVSADDGTGGADGARGSGLRGLVDRVEALDGELLVSSPPGGGTTITASLPCAS